MSYDRQSGGLKDIKKRPPGYRTVHSRVLQDVLRRLDKAFRNLFRRVKEKEKGKRVKVGFPRFKSHRSSRSITYPQSGFEITDDGHIKVSKIGVIGMFRHREVEGAIKTLTIKKDKVGDWFATFAVELPDVPGMTPATAISVDVGLEKLVTISTGEIIAPPKFLRRSEEKLKTVQRRVSRKEKGSNNRRKMARRLAKAHRKVQRQRDDSLHKESRKPVRMADLIAFEGLKINDMVKDHRLAKSIMDASWGKLMQYTAYKAESAGKRVESVDPRGTSQECSWCGNVVKKTLSDRVHMCPHCGLCLDRDLNSTFCIFKRVDADGVELLQKMPPEPVPLLSSQGDGKHG